MKTYYRLEGPDGFGVYSCTKSDGSTFCGTLGQHGVRFADSAHPSPYNDKLLGPLMAEHDVRTWSGTHRFVFNSIAQMKAWFPRIAVEDVVAEGARIVAISLPNKNSVLEGETQCMMPAEEYNPRRKRRMTVAKIYGKSS